MGNRTKFKNILILFLLLQFMSVVCSESTTSVASNNSNTSIITTTSVTTTSIPTSDPLLVSATTTNNSTGSSSKSISTGILKREALFRTFCVLLGVTSIVVVYFVIRTWRTRKQRNKSRKYGLISSGADLEMEPLDRDMEDDEDNTVFERQK